MFFLIRATFWLTVVLMFLPADPERGVDAPRVGILQALGAVRATFVDLSQFCTRNPEVCDTGSTVALSVADKARYNVRRLEEVLAGSAEEDAAEPAAVPEGTLTPADLAEPWRPVPQRRPSHNTI